MNKYASRKFILAVLALACSTWMLWEKLLSGADYKTLVIGTVGAYIVGNVAQKATVKNGGTA